MPPCMQGVNFMNYSTYLFSDVQKTMNKMFVGMTSRQFVKSSKVWSKLKLFCEPVPVFSSTDSIQCAVTAMNDVWFGSVHVSVVNEILPTDFYMGSKWVFYTKYEIVVTSISFWSCFICSSYASLIQLHMVEWLGISDSFSSSWRSRNIFLSLGDSTTLIAWANINFARN